MKIIIITCLISFNFFYAQKIEVKYEINNSSIDLIYENLENFPVEIIDPFAKNVNGYFLLRLCYGEKFFKFSTVKIAHNFDEHFIKIPPNQTLRLKCNLNKFLKNVELSKSSKSKNKGGIQEVIDVIQQKKYDSFYLLHKLFYKIKSGALSSKTYVLEDYSNSFK